MSLRQPSSTRTDTLCPYTTLWRSRRVGDHASRGRRAASHIDRRLTADAFARVARVARYPAEEAVEPPSAAAGAERARANDAGLDDGRTVDGDRRAAAATAAAVNARDAVERVDIVAREADAAFPVGRGRNVGCAERAARPVPRGTAH